MLRVLISLKSRSCLGGMPAKLGLSIEALWHGFNAWDHFVYFSARGESQIPSVRAALLELQYVKSCLTRISFSFEQCEDFLLCLCANVWCTSQEYFNRSMNNHFFPVARPAASPGLVQPKLFSSSSVEL